MTTDRAVLREYRGHFDLIINSTSADLDLNPYLRMLDVDGTLVIVGLSGTPVSLKQELLTDGRRSVSGSQIGGVAELQEMMDFCAAHGITARVEVIDAQSINHAWDRTVASDVKYRFVIDASTF